jgi:hypothetical protein
MPRRPRTTRSNAPSPERLPRRPRATRSRAPSPNRVPRQPPKNLRARA